MQYQRIYAFVTSTVLVTCALALDAASAMACEPGYCVDSVVPADGDSDVPTDTKIWVFYNHTRGTDPEITLEDLDAGESVPTSIELEPGGQSVKEVPNMVAVVTPDDSLGADTTYRVSFSGGAVCGSPTEPVEFTTGSSTAAPPEEFGDGIEISAACREAQEELNSCNKGTLFPYVEFGISTPYTRAATAYALYRDGDLISMSEASPVPVLMEPERVDESACFRLARLNIAGDEVRHDMNACPSLPSAPACSPDDGSDAGDVGTTDTGGEDAGDDGSHDEQRTDSVGCGCSAA
jgi:hypothetical protein